MERKILSFNAKDKRIMCFQHIINISVQHVLTKMSLVMAPENGNNICEEEISTENMDEGHRFGQMFEIACAQDPNARLCKIVMTIHSSGHCCDAFRTWIKTGNNNTLFVQQGRPIEIEVMQLLRDVHTRWDSSYNMIKRCIEMCLVSPPAQF